jgi:hypothetical protein
MRRTLALALAAASLALPATAAASFTPYDGAYGGQYKTAHVTAHFTVDTQHHLVRNFTRGTTVLFESTPLVHSDDRWSFNFRGSSYHVNGSWVTWGQVHGSSCRVADGGCDRGRPPESFSASNPRPTRGNYLGEASDGRKVHFLVRPPTYDQSLLVGKDLYFGDNYIAGTMHVIKNRAGVWQISYSSTYVVEAEWSGPSTVHGWTCRTISSGHICRQGEPKVTFTAHAAGS